MPVANSRNTKGEKVRFGMRSWSGLHVYSISLIFLALILASPSYVYGYNGNADGPPASQGSGNNSSGSKPPPPVPASTSQTVAPLQGQVPGFQGAGQTAIMDKPMDIGSRKDLQNSINSIADGFQKFKSDTAKPKYDQSSVTPAQQAMVNAIKDLDLKMPAQNAPSSDSTAHNLDTSRPALTSDSSASGILSGGSTVSGSLPVQPPAPTNLNNQSLIPAGVPVVELGPGAQIIKWNDLPDGLTAPQKPAVARETDTSVNDELTLFRSNPTSPAPSDGSGQSGRSAIKKQTGVMGTPGLSSGNRLPGSLGLITAIDDSGIDQSDSHTRKMKGPGDTVSNTAPNGLVERGGTSSILEEVETLRNAIAQTSKGFQFVIMLLALVLSGLIGLWISNFTTDRRRNQAERLRADEARRTQERLNRLETQIQTNEAHLVDPKSTVGKKAYSAENSEFKPSKQYLCHEPEEHCYYIVTIFPNGKRETHQVVEGSVLALARFSGKVGQNVRIESNGGLTPTVESERIGIHVKGEAPNAVHSKLMPLPDETSEDGDTRVQPKRLRSNEASAKPTKN